MFLKDFVSSINSYFKALKLINKLKLWKFFLVPAVLGLIIGAFLITTAFGLSDNVGAFISGFWPWDFGRNFVIGFSTWLGGFFILVLGILVYKHIIMALSAPFMTPVSEKVETYLTGIDVAKTESKNNFFAQLMRSIRLNFRNLTIELLVTLPLMILAIIPVVGIVFTAAIIYFQSYYTGFGNLDYTLERHLNYVESQSFVKKNKGIAVGNGLVFTLMLFIPFFGIMLALPVATVASTIDTIKKLHAENKLVLSVAI